MIKGKRQKAQLLCILVTGLISYFTVQTDAQDSCASHCGSKLPQCSCHVTCEPLGTCCTDYWNFCLRIFPQSGTLMGGEDFVIVNNTFQPEDQIVCRFKNSIVTKGYIENKMAHCISPLLYENGRIPFELSVDSGINYSHQGTWVSVHHGKFPDSKKSVLQNGTKWQYYGTPGVTGTLTLNWNRSSLPSRLLNVELWGYRENGTPYSDSWTGNWMYLYSIGEAVQNNGTFTFTPKSAAEKYLQWEIGILRLVDKKEKAGAPNVRALWSPSHALAWHLGEDFRRDSAAWAKEKCLNWVNHETTLPDFLSEIADCPCTLAQSRADTGRFHPDYGCDIEHGSVCTYHPGAVHCVRAIQASPQYGAGQQCCYDAKGKQILTADSTGGSTPDRAHDWGSPPYQKPPRVPGFSHGLYDVISFYYCCLWSDNCKQYMDLRPSSDCRTYRPPKVGLMRLNQSNPRLCSCNAEREGGVIHPFPCRDRPPIPGQRCLSWCDPTSPQPTSCTHKTTLTAGTAFGDPHLFTFDGANFTFNGKGEYTLVKGEANSTSGALQVQGRTELVKNINGANANVTGFTAVAMQEGDSDVIEFRIASHDNGSSLEVLINNGPATFHEQSWMDLKGVYLYSASPQNVTAMFPSGAGVEAEIRGSILSINILLPDTFTNQTEGLLGVMNDNVDDDFTFRNGSDLPAGAGEESIYAFGASWAIENKSSLFTYDSQFLLNNYLHAPKHDPAFTPVFHVSDNPANPLHAEMNALCEGIESCQFDTLVTKSLQVGKETKLSYLNYRKLVESLEPVTSCGVLEEPNNGKKKGIVYLIGSTVNFTCNQGHVISGSSSRTCLPNGQWSGEPTFCISENILGIVLGTLLAVFSLVLIGVILFINEKRLQRKKAKMAQSSFQNPNGGKTESS